MKLVLRAKFSQHTHLMQMLIGTGDAELVEDSPFDAFWGIGRDGAGQNQLGVLLQDIRAELRANSILKSPMTLSYILPGLFGNNLNLGRLRGVPFQRQMDPGPLRSARALRRSDGVDGNRLLSHSHSNELSLCQVSD
jgi:NADAR domain